VAVGDGRISLAHEPPRAFDVLVLDAFSSDSVPVHLLTREAFEIYRRQLGPDGLLLANVSNRHLDVERVVRGSARAVGLVCRIVETRSRAATYTSHVVWAIMATTDERLRLALGDLPVTVPHTDAVTWTDGRASLLSVLR
jgi:spermidine synthase